MKLIIPQKYQSLIPEELNRFAVEQVKETFEKNMADLLQIRKVSAPLIIESESGMSDNSMDNNIPVSFGLNTGSGKKLEIIRSATKWKRIVLADKLPEGIRGIWCDAMAVRPDETLSNIHSVYVDQWDWELIIRENQRNVPFLKKMADKVYQALKDTELMIAEAFPVIRPVLPDNLYFIHTLELAREYPDVSPEEREYLTARKYGAVFIMGIGNPLSPGGIHTFRTADYDDWSTPSENGFLGLNGDLIVWNPVLNQPLELSSMGIRVNGPALLKQAEILNCPEVLKNAWHKKLLAGELPQTIGGGIGQSRVCMFLLRKAHIGEVQPSVWPDEMISRCKASGIAILS